MAVLISGDVHDDDGGAAVQLTAGDHWNSLDVSAGDG
jgi:hypothetical protein